MNFFEHQDQARRQTKKLMALFVASIGTLVIGVYGVAMLTLVNTAPSLLRSSACRRAGYYTAKQVARCKSVNWVQPQIFLGIAGVTITIILLASLYKINQLKAGGNVVAESMGGRLVDANTRDEAERTLLNVVEEMAIAAGTPVPAVYLLDHEMGINAFAAGFTPNDAVIGVTRGSLAQFTRDELQGVIGHEFSHILNGDMRMNITLMGWLHGILCIYLIGRGCLEVGRGDRDGNVFAYFGIGLIVLGSSGLFFGRLMQSAISRQREYLADASAVQFTRNPDGIATALEKVGGIGSRVEASAAQGASHMFFGNVLSSWWSGEMFATHPPIADRVARVKGLRPGDYAGSVDRAAATSSSFSNSNPFAANVTGFTSSSAPTQSAWTSASLPEAVISTTPEQVITQIGTVDPGHYDYAKGLLAQIPSDLRSTLRDPHQAPRLIYALMLDRENPFTAQAQTDYLRQIEDAAGVEQVLQFQTQLNRLDRRVDLPLVDLAIAALRQKPPQDCQRILKAVHELAKVDGQWSLAEFVTCLVLQHRLQPHITQSATPPAIAYKDIAPVWDNCLQLISALAKVGNPDPKNAEFAFRSGLARLPGATQNPIPAALPTCNLLELRQTLDKLRLVSPKLKQGIVDACSQTVLIDQQVTAKEADLLRAIVILLDCPIPPFLDHAKIPNPPQKQSISG
ncbi:MAG: hypothetical protein RLZZ511_680 [Cyanobacteriota bacterium]|jgi:Zn-dependent protease with chaperone function